MNKSAVTILLIVGIVLFANLVSEQFFFRIDFTEDNQYTLSEATKNILEELEEPVTVKAYFSEELPPNIMRLRKEFEELLIEYGRLSNDNIIYEFINPNADEKIEQEAIQAGVQPVMINLREKDQMKQQKAFLGAVLELGDQKNVIPFIQPDAALEYAMSTSIKKISVLEKPTIGLIQGHGEPSLAELQQVHAGLNILYNVESFQMTDSTPIPPYINTLALLRPKDSISPFQFMILDAFLQRGGNLFVGINRVEGDLQNASGLSATTGLETWLNKKGILVENKFLVDANCGAVSVQEQRGIFNFARQVNFPYFPIVSNFSDHPITKGMEGIMMQFASPLRFTGDTSLKFTALIHSTKNSGNEDAPLYFDVQRQWTQNDFSLGKQVLAAALEMPVAQGKKSRLVVVGDGDFPVNGQGQQAQQLNPDNANLMVNSIDWLSDDTGLIELRNKGIAFRPLEELEDSTKTLLKYLNFLLPAILLAIYGIIRLQINRNKRNKRMQENYD